MDNIDIACDDLYNSVESYVEVLKEFKALFISLRDSEIEDKAYLRQITRKLDGAEKSLIDLLEVL